MIRHPGHVTMPGAQPLEPSASSALCGAAQPHLYGGGKEWRTESHCCPPSQRLQCIRMHPILNCGNTVPLQPLSSSSLQLLGSEWASVPMLMVWHLLPSQGGWSPAGSTS